MTGRADTLMSSTVENMAQIAKNASMAVGGGATAVVSPSLSFPEGVNVAISIIGCAVGVWGGFHLRKNWQENKRRNDIYDRDVSLREKQHKLEIEQLKSSK